VHDNGFRSGELARRAGVSPDTLRHYERAGLLPAPPRTANGYRHYPASALDRVRTIRAALSVGFSIAELAEVFAERDRGHPPCVRVRSPAAEKLALVEARLRELEAVRNRLAELLVEWDARLGQQAPTAARLLESLGADGADHAPPSRDLERRRPR
jgi:DNA-binding transcriptional MerR regulator